MKHNARFRGVSGTILGCRPTIPQIITVWVTLLTLLLWPIVLCFCVFFFDTPVKSTIDLICRLGMVFPILFYPLYMLPLIRLWFMLSNKIGVSWVFYFCPLIPLGSMSIIYGSVCETV